MLGDSSVLGTGGGSSTDAVAAMAVPASAGGAHDRADTVAGGGGGGGGSNSGDDERFRGEESDRSFGGNRWPRQETLALLKIRSDMDVAFRDASVKGPLWEEVSRKMAELGYQRNSKKCKEKFENVYKYHKRTKEGRTGKSEGKTYRFFDQLEALENNPSIQIHSPTIPSNSKPPQTAPLPATPVSIVLTNPNSNPITPPPPTTTIATTVQFPLPISVPPHSTSTVPLPTLPIPPMSQGFMNNTTNPTFFPTANPTYPSFDDLLSNSSSSSTSSDKTFEEEGRRRRKRKWKDFFEGLMKEVIHKQEEMQKGFLEAIEKREQERLVREEAWRMQEMQRINKEREILAQERSIAQAKDAAVMAFLQKIAEQQNLGPALSNLNNSTPVPPPLTQTTALAPVNEPVVPIILAPHEQQQRNPQVEKSQPQPQPQPQPQQQANMEMVRVDNNGENLTAAMSSSRWPKVEVEALINLRKSLDTKYQENGPKGPLWEEISGLMKKMGYNRNAKRCKEKWENINKYFKKVKESNKKRPDDSKTCPYFHQLDALYKEKNKLETSFKPESTMAPLMVRPEQQWPPQQQQDGAAVPDVSMGDAQNDPMETQQRHSGEDNEDNDDKDMEDYDEDDDEDEDEDDGDGGNKYEIVASKPPSADASA